MSNTNPRPMYFSQVRIDPNNDQRIWVAGVNMEYSEDGGKTFVENRVTRIHVDFHAIWIDPANSDNMIVGCDGGIHFSRDAGRSWDAREQIAIGQFYEIAYDMAQALQGVRRIAGQRFLVRPQRDHQCSRHHQRGLVHGGGRRWILRADRSGGAVDRLRGIAGRQFVAARSAHPRIAQHPAARGR